MNRNSLFAATILSLVATATVHAQATPSLTAALMEGMPLRSIGPAVTPGRVGDIAVDPTNDSTWYIAAASSGLWKTTNRGVTWKPIFDHYGSFSLGCITIDPADSGTLWLGTGENQAQRSVGFGDGIYKSTDAGATWLKSGLPNSEHIGKIVVDPRNSKVVYAAAQGPLWAPGGDRGLFKTTDGGTTWKPILQISENTGITDVAFDPRTPDLLYVAAYQRRRNVGVLVGGGPEGAIYKSTDAGDHWTKLTQGLPTADVGRIALAVSPQKPDVVYAYIIAAQNQQGLYRSADKGETWTRQSNLNSVDPQYYGEIYTDPHQFDHLWIMDVNVHETADGGKTFQNAFAGLHVDNHALWLDPKDPRHLLEGNDGGLYESTDKAVSWRHFTNLPTTQFYHVAVDNALPFYNVAGGAQDNGSSAGPSSTLNRVGIRSGDWITIGGADGMQPRIDPEDPSTVYSMSQNGSIQRLDKRTSLSKGIKPVDNSAGPLRWNWDAPFHISSHSHTRLYLAANRLFRSDDRGDSWTPISPDLTRHLNRATIELMGRTWDDNAISRNLWTTDLSICTAMAESQQDENLLVVGTDDGLIQVSADAGKTWRKIDTFPGVPDVSFVTSLQVSQHEPGTLYATFNNYQRGDFKPYLLRSPDLGKTWSSIAGDLPQRHPVWSIIEDPVNKNLLFAGTEFGLFFSVDVGVHWVELKGNTPTIAFRDLQIQKRESDLVGASFGRGFFILDDVSPLRTLTSATLAQEAVLFPMRQARQFSELTYVRNTPDDFTAPNAPFGAIITYYLNHDLPGAAAPAGGRGRGPGASTGLVLAVADAAGTSLRQIDGPATAGLHRVTWDLRGGTPVAAGTPIIDQGEEFNPEEEEDEDQSPESRHPDADVDPDLPAAPEGAMTPPQTTSRPAGGDTQPLAAQTGPAASIPARGGRGGGRGGAAALPQVKAGTYKITLGHMVEGTFTPLAAPQTLEVIPLQPASK